MTGDKVSTDLAEYDAYERHLKRKRRLLLGGSGLAVGALALLATVFIGVLFERLPVVLPIIAVFAVGYGILTLVRGEAPEPDD